MGLVYNPFGTANAVHEFVNTAYDIVRSVHENLPNIVNAIEVSLAFQVSATPPALRADGTALQPGDKYFDGNQTTYTRSTVNTWVVEGVNWDGVTNLPTTVAGYGITDVTLLSTIGPVAPSSGGWVSIAYIPNRNEYASAQFIGAYHSNFHTGTFKIDVSTKPSDGYATLKSNSLSNQPFIGVRLRTHSTGTSGAVLQVQINVSAGSLLEVGKSFSFAGNNGAEWETLPEFNENATAPSVIDSAEWTTFYTDLISETSIEFAGTAIESRPFILEDQVIANKLVAGDGAGNFVTFTSGGAATARIDVATGTETALEFRSNGINRTIIAAGNNGYRLLNSSFQNLYRYLSGVHQFYSEGTATLKLETGGGLNFANVSASSDLNTLDDYEQGVWTPTLTGGTTNPTQSYATQVGQYTKIGSMVYINCKIAMSSTGITSGSGAARISGLPFSAANTGDHSINIGDAQNWSSAGLGAPSSGYIAANLNFIILNVYENSNVKQPGLLTAGASDITNNTYIVVSASYEVA